MTFTYKINGMHCASCVSKIKSALSPHFQVLDVTLNPPRLHLSADQKPLLDDLNKTISLAGNYNLEETSLPDKNHHQHGLYAYFPIFLIALYITGVASINNLHQDGMDWLNWMNQFMAGFFLVFSAFKLLDIRGFADGYATYDILAKRWRGYGYLYPFMELGLGILYLTNWLPTMTSLITIILMGFSSLGVMLSLSRKQIFQCACLGTILKVPLSRITLIEDLSMVVMATLTLMM